MQDVQIELSSRRRPDDERTRILERPEFGRDLTDHMVVMEHRDGRWGPLRLVPTGPLSLSPATLALHYGQSAFEALKAYASPSGGCSLFRPDRNAARFARSAARVEMPVLPDGAFELACALLARADRDWVPEQDGSALYLRPLMFASEPHLSVRPATQYQFVVIASPVASYFGPQLGAISVAVERRDVRAATGGTGAVKFAGNYAAGFAAHGRSIRAGADQVLWLDAVERRWIEELNAMNVMLVWRTGDGGPRLLTTPPLSGTILDGVTRESILALAAEELDVEVEERPTSIEQLRSGCSDGALVEMFACGTAAVVAPIGSLLDDGERVLVGDGRPGAVTASLRARLLDVQHGRSPDLHGWRHQVDDVLAHAGVDPAALEPATAVDG